MDQADIQPLPLDPRYKPPKGDLFIMVRFIGNTAHIADIGLSGVGVGHIDAARAELGRVADRMADTGYERALAKAKRDQIAVPGSVPPMGLPGLEGWGG